MDFQEARDRRATEPTHEAAARDQLARRRASDARLRRAIRDAHEDDPAAEIAPPHLKLVKP
jgi:hypothetical protein